MSKYTPGPWVTDGYNVIRVKKRSIGEIDGEVIASVRSWKDGDKKAIANAQLIAAAPDLLEALKDMINYSYMRESWQESEGKPRVAKAIQLIAKVEGE